MAPIMERGDQVLETELATYARERAALLAKAENKFVLIHGEDVIGIYDSPSDAVRQAYQQFGNVPFLVKHVLRVEQPAHFTSNHLAI